MFPWLVKSEVMHFTYAVLMFIGLVLLRPGFRGTAKTWWTVSLGIQGWHLVEHSLLQLQAITGQNLFGSPVPTSIVQQFVPRPELHLLYNLAVFVPMVVAMWLHTRPNQAAVNDCTLRRRTDPDRAGGPDRRLTGGAACPQRGGWARATSPMIAAISAGLDHIGQWLVGRSIQVLLRSSGSPASHDGAGSSFAYFS